MESIFFWTDLLKFAIILALLFVLLKAISWVAMKLSKKIRTKQRLEKIFERIFIMYVPVSIMLLLITYVGINFLIHGILVLAIGIIGFNYIRSFINGVHFKNNPLVRQGNYMEFENETGTIERLLPFGVILNGLEGKKFINYSEIEKKGFGMIKDQGDSQRISLKISSEDEAIDVLDLLFENPLVSFYQAPTVRMSPEDNGRMLEISLEKGATIEEIIAFLEYNKVKATHYK